MKITIAGKMGSGKTFLANSISKNFDFTQTSFALRVKELAVELFDMSGKDRTLLIDFATKMRDIDDTVWIRSMLRHIDGVENVVLDDLRLRNEYDTLRSHGWIIVKLKVHEDERQRRLCEKYKHDHTVTWLTLIQ